MNRYVLVLALSIATIGVPSLLAPGLRATPPGAGPAAPATPPGPRELEPEVPAAVREAAEQGRYWRASRLLDDYLAAARDTAPATILLAARLEAGWGNWRSVARLLEGRAWLDRVEDGAGWRLLGRGRIALGRLEEGSDALDRYLRVATPGPRDAGVARLRQGLALGEAGEVVRALEAFDSAAARLPWMADWAAYFGADAAASAGDTAEVRRRLAAAGDMGGERGWPFRIEAALESGDTMAAREAALAAAEHAPSSADRATAWARLGRLRLAGGDTARAREAFRLAMEGAPGSVGAVEAARAMTELGPTPEEWRTIGLIYRRHGNMARAVQGLQSYLDGDVGSASERARTRLLLGRALFDAGRYRTAERRLTALAADSVPDRIAAEALYLVGRARYRQGRSEAGQQAFLDLAKRFPHQTAAARGLYLLADLKHDDREIDDARTYYRAAAEASPDLNEAGLALMRLAGLAFLDEKYDSAAAIFEEYRRLHPDGRRTAQATYWAARAYSRLGRSDSAAARLRALRESDPLSYYGVRAAEALGEPVLDVPMEPAPARDSGTAAVVEKGLRRVDVLEELDRRDDLVYEVERLRDHFERQDGGEYALAEALNHRGYTLTGISIGWALHRREGAWNPRLLRIVYPFPYRQMVVPEAREAGLDPYLVAAVIRRESAFNPDVVSGAGAIGLMQIMPGTGRGLASGAGLRHFTSGLLTEPEVNLHLGVRYLASLMDRFDGRVPLVLSAYNAGPNRAVRWREMPEAVDPELLTERVPYAETRDYIRNVLLHRALYRALYPGLDGAG